MTPSTLKVAVLTYAKPSAQAATTRPANKTGAPGSTGKTKPAIPADTRMMANNHSRISVTITINPSV